MNASDVLSPKKSKKDSWYVMDRRHIVDASVAFDNRMSLASYAEGTSGAFFGRAGGARASKDESEIDHLLSGGHNITAGYGISHDLAELDYRDHLGNILHRPMI